MKRFSLCLILVLSAGGLLKGQGYGSAELTVRPADAPEPALKYELLPPLHQRKPGNAALLYDRASILVRSNDVKTMKKIYDWLDMPLDALPRDQVRELLQSQRGVLDELGLAARRKRCDWLLPLEEQGASGVLLPELQELRNLGRLLGLQIRLQISEGRTEEALASLQVGFALARHAGEGGTVIHGFIGIAVATSMLSWSEELIERPDAPNLYWALTTLPQPLVDFRPAMELERALLFLDVPMLRGADRHPLAAEQQRTLEAGLRRILTTANRPPHATALDLDALVTKALPAAKENLIQRGAAAEEVARMSDIQVVAADAAYTYRRLGDAMFKWFHLPYWQAKEQLEESQRAIESANEGMPLAKTLLADVRRLHVAGTRPQRDIAGLRCVEAIRMYAAAHDGRLPEKLVDITQVPVPEDPYTGREFSYSVQGNVATLESAGPKGLGAGFAKRWKITIRR